MDEPITVNNWTDQFTQVLNNNMTNSTNTIKNHLIIGGFMQELKTQSVEQSLHFSIMEGSDYKYLPSQRQKFAL